MKIKVVMGSRKPEVAMVEMPVVPRLGEQMRIGTNKGGVRVVTHTPLEAEQDAIVECF